MASGDPRTSAAQSLLQRWLDLDEELHAPALLPYEVASGLTRLVAAGAVPTARLNELWTTVTNLRIVYHTLDGGEQAISVALRLGRRSAYDAAYLVLAPQLATALWTFDGPLARNAIGLGFPVRLVQ